MPFTIAKQFSFSASHQLDHLPDAHPCARLHGHNYTVEVILGSPFIDPDTGFVQDYRNLDRFKAWIDQNLDHRHLNDAFQGESRSTTAEALAAFLYRKAWQLIGRDVQVVRVSETPKTWAEWREV